MESLATSPDQNLQADGLPTQILAPNVLAAAKTLRQTYTAASPFPHIVIDEFLRPDVAAYLADNFPAMEQMPFIFNEPMSYKGQLSDITGKWPDFSGVFDALQSAEFRAFITSVTGIDNLIADPDLAGGGLHQSPKSGFLDIHVDANFHPLDKTMHRRVNVLIYVSRGWQSEWGGELQLWSDNNKKPARMVHKIGPEFNRAVIFNTTRTSWHGVGPVSCPAGTSRRSLALYYYTHDRPDTEVYRDSSVIWMNRSVLWKRALYPVMNVGIALLKPYAKQLRTVLGRDRVFDAASDRDRADRS